MAAYQCLHCGQIEDSAHSPCCDKEELFCINDMPTAIIELREALAAATAHLAGAASAYRTYAKRSPLVGKADTDPFFSTRAQDFDKAAEAARQAWLKYK